MMCAVNHMSSQPPTIITRMLSMGTSLVWSDVPFWFAQTEPTEVRLRTSCMVWLKVRHPWGRCCTTLIIRRREGGWRRR